MNTKTITSRTSFLQALYLFLVACITAPGCDTTAPQLNSAQSYQDTITASSADSMHVYDSTCTRLSGLFNTNVALAPREVAMTAVEQELLWSDIASRLPHDTFGLHGLVLDYGLSNDSMRYGISFVGLSTTRDPKTFTYNLPDSLYALEAGILRSMGALDWRNAHQYNPKDSTVYFSRVLVRNGPSASFQPVDYTSTPHAQAFAWEDELQALYDQNSTGHRDSTFYLVLRCMLRPDARGELKQSTCFNLRLRANGQPTGAYRDLMNNTPDRAAPLRMHGADFGSLCPDNCSQYTLVPR